ncbi:MAG: efflux RND transporter periplasmic adaptor subunit, partial [Bryobacteraceae bacterium]
AALGALALVSCGGPASEKKTEAAPAGPTLQVTAVAVSTADWPVVYEAVGSVRARTSSAISSRIVGYIREVRAEVGSHVRAGQVLIVLDARDLDAGYRQAEAGRNEARAAAGEADNAIAGAQAALDLAGVTRKRMKDLFDQRSVSNQEYDEADARFRQAQAALDGARSRRARVNDSIAQADAVVQSASVARSYTQIAAPFSGLVVEKRAEPGALAAPGAPLLILEQEGGWRFEAAVDEAHLPQIRIGQTASVQLDALDREIQAKVVEIVPMVDAASRSATVKLDLPSMANLRSGVFGRARFPSASRRAISVPANAVIERGQLQQVFVLEQGIARLRIVTAGSEVGGRREILSGLAGQESVIAPVPPDLAGGARVEVRP